MLECEFILFIIHSIVSVEALGVSFTYPPTSHRFFRRLGHTKKTHPPSIVVTSRSAFDHAEHNLAFHDHQFDGAISHFSLTFPGTVSLVLIKPSFPSLQLSPPNIVDYTLQIMAAQDVSYDSTDEDSLPPPCLLRSPLLPGATGCATARTSPASS